MDSDSWVKIERKWHFFKKHALATICGRSNARNGLEYSYVSQKRINIPENKKCKTCVKYLDQIKRGTRT